jgi:hypothetical protein
MTQVIPTVGVIGQRALPECWGHRGASAVFPENTLASFEAAMRDGAEGIESGRVPHCCQENLADIVALKTFTFLVMVPCSSQPS